jgi:predicted DNA binding CopG/RHH family protein
MADARKPGRPPLDRTDPERSVPICLRLPSRAYDRVHDRASAAGVSVPELLRRTLRQAETDDDD